MRATVLDGVHGAVAGAAAPGEDVMVIGHSLGTIVAYELLQKSRDLPVLQLVICGSPLGSATIQDDVHGDVPLTFPPELTDWLNVYFENDYVASEHDFSTDFPSGDQRRIVNLDASRDSPREWLPWLSHDLDIYLASPDLAKGVVGLLGAKANP